VSEDYDGRQFVGMDLHRRRSVLVRMTETGQRLETVRIVNDRDRLAAVMARAGEAPEVVLEATYGWYWAADALAESGARVHLAHPLGVKAFAYRRVKTDERDAADLADLLRMGRLPEAWIAPPATRELRELVRHRAKLVHLRSGLRSQVHAVLAGQGVTVPVSDLFGLGGMKLLERATLSSMARARVDSLLRLIEVFDVEIDQAAKTTSSQLRAHPGYAAVQTLPGVGPILGAVFVVEIGEVTRFPDPTRLASWAGLTPQAPRVRHHRAPWPDHQAGQSASPLGCGRGGTTHQPAHPYRGLPRPDRRTTRPQHRRHRRRPGTDRMRLLRAARWHRQTSRRRRMTNIPAAGRRSWSV
jgi:transposase